MTSPDQKLQALLSDEVNAPAMSVSEAVASRRSIRDFTDEPVPYETLLRVMEKARLAPSGSNFQPWEATILTGEPLRALRAKMSVSPMQQPLEYVIQPADIPAEYPARLAETTAKQYESQGIPREDKDKRMAAIMRNVDSFGAPVLLLCYLPREEGLDSCPQEFLSMYGRLIKEHIGVSDETYVFFCGVGIGYRTETPVNSFERSRVPLERQVRFAGF
jgi:nitroreductase